MRLILSGALYKAHHGRTGEKISKDIGNRVTFCRIHRTSFTYIDDAVHPWSVFNKSWSKLLKER